MKTNELKLISELMKNSRRSDRELARTMGVSQPTISRMIKKLEREGTIREYTMIPDFTKLGYHLMVLTFAKFHETVNTEKLQKAARTSQQRLGELQEAVMLERGIGLGSNGVVISLHKDYSSLVKQKEWLRQFPFLGEYELETFIINLDDETHYRYLTFSTLANHLQILKEEKKNKRSEQK